ncbi:MAG: biliverdin-producing heme oxygenase [Candidatus Sericytochromatia bacterium]
MIIQKIREKTLQFHDEFTGWAFKIMNGTVSEDEYKKALKIFYGFYKPLEEKILLVDGVDLDLAKRIKVELLIKDMKDLGVTEEEIGQITLCNDLPEIENQAKLLGCMYVIEGATLGGQLVGGKLDEFLRLNGNGSRFFYSYKENVRPFWKEFMDYINEYSAKTGIEDEIVESSFNTYMKFNKWLLQLKGITF